MFSMAVYGPHCLNQGKIPTHVAMIMDGNGRWAMSQGQQRTWGHNEGVSSVRKVVRYTNTLGVKYLTLYAFSEENWKRPKAEVDFIFSLIARYLKAEIEELDRQNVCVAYIGDFSKLGDDVKESLAYAEKRLSKNTGLTLIIALSYGSRSEIVHACKSLLVKVQSEEMGIEDIDQEAFSRFLQTSSYPDPDLLIRTSGELRISNFLLWQLAYSELYFSDKMWPEFESWHYLEAVAQYQQRKRRYGTIHSH
jgi:undecaprenyl diphosphate synthase